MSEVEPEIYCPECGERSPNNYGELCPNCEQYERGDFEDFNEIEEDHGGPY